MTQAADAFLCDLDQAARREELRAFIGPNVDIFLKVYDAMRAGIVSPKGTAPWQWGFVALAMFLAPCWLLYRKMWMWGGGLLALTFVPVPLELPLALACGVFGRTFYLNHAMARITALRGDATRADLEALAKAGGVSKLAGWISGVLLIALAAAAVATVIMVVQDADPSSFD